MTDAIDIITERRHPEEAAQRLSRRTHCDDSAGFDFFTRSFAGATSEEAIRGILAQARSETHRSNGAFVARAYGACDASTARTEDFAPAFEEAAEATRAAIIELAADPENITTRTTLSALRQEAEAQPCAKPEA